MFSALLDTCVLVPSFLRDLLLELAASQAYRPVWSNRIEEELRRVLVDLWHKKDLSPEHIEGRLERLLDQMNRAFPDAKLMIPPEVVASLPQLPDPDDVHVVTAALLGRADVIVTRNLKDFPAELLPGELRHMSPDDFLLDTYDLFPNKTWEAIGRIRARSGKRGPKIDDRGIFQRLEREELQGLVQALREE